MDAFELTRFIIVLVFILGILVFSLLRLFPFEGKLTARTIVKTAIFASISIILYIVPYLKFAVPFFPAFLELHFDEIPAFIAGFAYGPFVGFLVILIKTIVKLPMTTTMCVGELADFIYSCAFILPVSIIYKRHRNLKGAIVGLVVATIIQMCVASIITSFPILNFYMFVMGLSKETILGMCQAINPRVTSLGWTFLFLVALPFNALKDAIVIIVTFILYKRLHGLIDKIKT